MRKRLVIIIFALAVFAVIWIKPFYVAPILMYHAINPIPHTDTQTIPPEIFERQMEYIYSKGYRVISLGEYVKGRLKGRFMKNVVILTFDDGYADNYLYAYPVLKKYGFPATIFIITKFAENNPRFLKFPQMREMAENGIEFGSHTITHKYILDAKNQDELVREISGSKQILEQELGRRVDFFSYVLGYYNEMAKELVKQAGYPGAVTTSVGPGKLNKDLYALKRIKMAKKDVPSFTLRLKLSGYYWLFSKDKDLY